MAIDQSNPSVGLDTAAAPNSSTAIGFKDGSGNLQVVSASNPLPISGAGGGGTSSNFGAAFPAAGTAVGFKDNSGNMAAGNLDGSGNLKVAGTFSAGESVLNVTGSASSAAVLSNFPVNPTTGYRSAAVQVTSVGSGCTLVAEQSNDGTTWTGLQSVSDTTVETSTPMAATGLYTFNFTGLEFRVRCSIYGSGTPAVNAELRQEAALPLPVPYLSQINATLGTPMQTTGGTVGLVAGSAVIGGVELVDSGGTNKASVSAGGALKVDGSSVTQSVNIAQVAGNTVATSGTGLQRVGIVGVGGNGIDASLGANTAPANGIAIIAQYNSSLPSPTSGQTIGVQADAKGNLRHVIMDGAGNARAANVTSANALVVDGSAVTQPISAVSLPLPTGAATSAKQPALGTAGTASSDVLTVQGIAGMTKLLVTPDALPANQSVNLNQVVGTTCDVNTGNASAGTQRVVLASNQPAVPITPPTTATGTQSSVAASASSVTILAANSSRKGATVTNDAGGALLYLLLSTGGTASATAYTVPLVAGAYYEVPFGYTGALVGIWASASGAARVTEFT